MDFGKEKIRGIDYHIYIDSAGQFCCDTDGAQASAPSLEELKKKLLAHSKNKLKGIKIPFAFWEDDWSHEHPRIRQGICTGVHAANNNLIVLFDGEKTTRQLAHYRRSSFVRPEDAKQLEKLQRDIMAAKEALDKFFVKYGFDVRAEVRKLLGDKDDE